MADLYDRRQSDEPFTVERRIAERVSILEIRADNHDSTIAEHHTLIERFFNKFDEHISKETIQSQSISNTMLRVSNTVDNLTTEIKRTNDTLVTFATKVDTTHNKVTEWDTIVRTVAKIVTISAILVGAGWSVYTFAVGQSKIQITANETTFTNNIQ